MATAQYYKKNNNGLTVGGITQIVPVTPPPVAPPSSLRYKQDGIAGYTPPVQPGGINKATGRPNTGVSSAPSGGMIGGNMYNSMVAQNAAAQPQMPTQQPASSYGTSPNSAASQNYAAYMMATNQLPERLAALGIYGTGQAESSQLQLDSAYAQAIAAYRGQQGGSGAQITGGSGSTGSAGRISGDPNDTGGWRTDPTTGYMYRFNRETGKMESRMPMSSGGSYSPMNPAGHDLGQLADGSWYDYTLGVSYTDPNYMAYYTAYNETQAQQQAAATSGSGGTNGTSGGGSGGTSGSSTGNNGLRPGTAPGGYAGYGLSTSALSGSDRDKLKYFGINPDGMSDAEVQAILNSTQYVPTYTDPSNPGAGMYLSGYPYWPSNPVADFRLLDPKPVYTLPSNYPSSTATPIKPTPSPTSTPWY